MLVSYVLLVLSALPVQCLVCSFVHLVTGLGASLSVSSGSMLRLVCPFWFPVTNAFSLFNTDIVVELLSPTPTVELLSPVVSISHCLILTWVS